MWQSMMGISSAVAADDGTMAAASAAPPARKHRRSRHLFSAIIDLCLCSMHDPTAPWPVNAAEEPHLSIVESALRQIANMKAFRFQAPADAAVHFQVSRFD